MHDIASSTRRDFAEAIQRSKLAALQRENAWSTVQVRLPSSRIAFITHISTCNR